MKGMRVGEAAKALGLGVDAVRRLADAGTLRTVRSRGGQRLVDARSVAALAASRGRARPSRSAASRVSPRNRFAGIVTSVVKDRLVARVEMRAGPHRIVAMVTREAADELGLRPGVEAVASVKAFHVHLEVPDAGGRG